ncbi:MAG: hypothetical protein L3J39_06590 [Verrucomicrobiales bacterium]|nr:hypothetical protein [Verrucomicrobiales bacterium]
MIAKQELTIIERIRMWKEQNAAEFDFDADRIIESARERERSSGEILLDPPKSNGGKQTRSRATP